MTKEFLDPPNRDEALDAHARVEELVDLDKFTDHELGALMLDATHLLSKRTGGNPSEIAAAMAMALAIGGRSDNI